MVGAISHRFLSALETVTQLPRAMRRWIVFALDCVLCVLAALAAMAIRLGGLPDDLLPVWILSATAIGCWTAIAYFVGVYLNLIRFSGSRMIAQLLSACALLAVPLCVIFGFVTVDGVPRTISVLHPLVFFILTFFLRLVLRFVVSDLLHGAQKTGESRRRVLIYGAGRGGQQLANALQQELQLQLVGYVDDDPRLQGQQLDGRPIWHADYLAEVLQARGVSEVLLAIPSATKSRRREIVETLQTHRVRVRTLPAIGQLIDGTVNTSHLREVQIEDLLGRDPIAPDDLLMRQSLIGKTVLVTGAGGSIGSELCRQILRANPERLILVEQSEFGLYAIERELQQLAAAQDCPVDLVAELADVADREAVYRIFDHWKPQSVYHAAAYKHVPLVEANPISGLHNNIFGTLYCAMAAEEVGVERFILVSTDKAVRPTNIMGATKRVCELIVQARAQVQSKTLFTMVRFGNVLGSSGSVIPLFKSQIAAGGPLTVTHKEVTRYFMTIPEAVQLVIQAGGMARGGEVFVLDMGQPIRILDLAETMVKLSGLTLKSEQNPQGDIAIVEVGLRPGEKLYEELLIGDNPVPTEHARILKAREAVHPWDALAVELSRLKNDLRAGDAYGALTILCKLVPEYTGQALQAHSNGDTARDAELSHVLD